jgi:hypothetical protein
VRVSKETEAACLALARPPRRPVSVLGGLLPYPLVVPVWGVKTVSESNARVHWAVRHRRFKEQRQQVASALMPYGDVLQRVGNEVAQHDGRIVVTLTRLGRGRLDTGNDGPALKAVQDEVAKWLGVDDGCRRIAWRYEQRKGEDGVIVEVRA